jgi:hypothetical protein
VLLLTADPFYSLHGVRPGASLAAARRVLKLSRPFHVGLNDWYLAAHGAAADGVLKVRHGMVEEVGIADKRFLHGRRAEFRFLNSFR